MSSKKIFYLFVLLAGLLSFKLLFSVPSILSDIRFDGQNLIVWKYAAHVGMLPYKDVFYPYGILNYYVNVQFIATFLNSLFFFSLLLVFYILFSKIFTKSAFGSIASCILIAVILFVSGISAFLRYGIATCGALLLSYILYKNNLNSKIAFLFGLLSGILVFMVTDQGIYLVLFFTIFYWLNALFKQRKKILTIKNVKLYLIFLLGIGTGTLPFVLYYIHLNMLNDFILHFIRTPDISLYAKAPYFHSLKSISGIFNSVVFFSSISYLSYVYFLHKKRITKGYYALFALTVVFFVIEQKGIIRSLGQQISFVSVLMGMVLLYELFQEHIRKLHTIFIYTSVALFLGLFLYCLMYPLPGFIQSSNLDFKKNSSGYIPVLTTINSDKNSSARIFAMPTDPIMYIANNQKPPYFFTVYDGSPRYAQDMSIEYIKNNNIKYIVYNTAVTSVQDGVPDYLRVPYEFSYIFNHFYPYTKVGTYIILKKGEMDFFDQKLRKKFVNVQDYFQKIDVGSIPYSEGYYKKNLFKNDLFAQVRDARYMSIPSRDKFLLIYFKKNAQSTSTITIQTKDNLKTDISFTSCMVNFPCIINLSNIPLFYKNRSISSIIFDTNSIREIRITSHKEKSSFW